MSLNRDTMKERELNQELSVIIIPNTVYIHETDMNLKINKKIGLEIYNRVSRDDFYGIALGVKEDNLRGLYVDSDLYKVGTLIKVEDAREMKDFFQLKLKIIERAAIKEFIPEDGDYRATYELQPDIDDLKEEEKEEIRGHIRYLVKEISENFKGSKSLRGQGEPVRRHHPDHRLHLPLYETHHPRETGIPGDTLPKGKEHEVPGYAH